MSEKSSGVQLFNFGGSLCTVRMYNTISFETYEYFMYKPKRPNSTLSLRSLVSAVTFVTVQFASSSRPFGLFSHRATGQLSHYIRVRSQFHFSQPMRLFPKFIIRMLCMSARPRLEWCSWFGFDYVNYLTIIMTELQHMAR